MIHRPQLEMLLLILMIVYDMYFLLGPFNLKDISGLIFLAQWFIHRDKILSLWRPTEYRYTVL